MIYLLFSFHLEVHKVADQCKSEWIRDQIAFYRIHWWSEIPTDWSMIWLIPIDEMRLLMELMNCFFFEQFESIVSTIDCSDWLIVSVVIYMVFSWTNAMRKIREMEAEQLMTPRIRRYSQCFIDFSTINISKYSQLPQSVISKITRDGISPLSGAVLDDHCIDCPWNISAFFRFESTENCSSM